MTHNFGSKRWLHLTKFQFSPVYTNEKWMLIDGNFADAWHATQTLLEILRQKLNRKKEHEEKRNFLLQMN